MFIYFFLVFSSCLLLHFYLSWHILEQHNHKFQQLWLKHASCLLEVLLLLGRNLKALRYTPIKHYALETNQKKKKDRESFLPKTPDIAYYSTYRIKQNVWCFEISIDDWFWTIMEESQSFSSTKCNLHPVGPWKRYSSFKN